MRRSAKIINVGTPHWNLDTDLEKPISNMISVLKSLDIIKEGQKTNIITLNVDDGVYFTHASVLTVNGHIAMDKDNTSTFYKDVLLSEALVYIKRQKNSDFIILASEHFVKDLQPLVDGMKSTGVRVKSSQTVEELLSVFK